MWELSAWKGLSAARPRPPRHGGTYQPTLALRNPVLRLKCTNGYGTRDPLWLIIIPTACEMVKCFLVSSSGKERNMPWWDYYVFSGGTNKSQTGDVIWKRFRLLLDAFFIFFSAIEKKYGILLILIAPANPLLAILRRSQMPLLTRPPASPLFCRSITSVCHVQYLTDQRPCR